MVKGLVRIKWKSLKIPIQSTSVNWIQIRCVFVLRYGAKCVLGFVINNNFVEIKYFA